MNIISLFTLIFGLSSSYLFVYYIDRSGQRITPSIIFKTVSIYLSLLILIGYILDSFKLHVYILYYLMIFIIILSLLLVSNIRRKKMTRSEINSRLDIVCFFGLVFLGFIILIIPFIGVWFPLSRGVDAANHFSYIEHIFRNQMISQENFNYTKDNIVAYFIAYPFGAHLVTALFSSIFNLQPIRLVYPFMALITALTTGAIYIVSCESKTSKVGAFAGGLLTITTSYFFVTLIENGSLGQVVGNFLVMAFTIFFIDYLKESILIKMLPIILINMAIVLTYSLYIPIPLILFTFIFIYKEGYSKRLIQYLLVFLVSYIPLTPFLVNLIYKNFVMFQNGEVPRDVLENFGPIFLLFFICGIIIVVKSTDKITNNLVVLGLLTAIVVQTLLIGFGMLFGFKDYWFYKMFLLMVFPLGIFAAIGIDFFMDRLFGLLKNEKRDNIKSYFFIVCLISLAIIGTIIQISYTHHYSLDEKPVITQDEYEALMWIDNNIPTNDRVAYIADDYWVRTFWRIVISHRVPDMLIPSQFIRYIRYDQFITYISTHAKDGTIIYVQNTTRLNDSINFLDHHTDKLYYLKFIKELYYKNDTAVYRFNSSQLINSSIIFLGDNWYSLEGKFVWISNNATILYYSPKNRSSELSFNVTSFYKPRTLQVYINDEPNFQMIVSQQKLSMEIHINEGKNTIRFYIVDGCQRPLDIPGLNNRDDRCLSLAFHDMSIT